MGNGNPNFIDLVLKKASKYLNFQEVALHLHNTFGFALANTLTALSHGIYKYESTIGGLGGCPFAPGAAGNIATEDLVNFLTSIEYKTNINFDLLLSSVSLLESIIPNSVTSNIYKYQKGKTNGN